MFKLLFSSYFILIVPYVTSMMTTQFLINNNFISDGRSNDVGSALILLITIYIVEQLAAVAIIKRLLFRR